MKILKLTLNNFGPYFGTQSLDLDVSDNAPIILVYGENERGKTSLLRAIRWCLYGEVLNQGGTLMDEREFANYDARDRKEPFDVFVEIEFEDQGVKSVLKRWMKVKESDLEEIRIETLSKGVDLRPNNGNPVAEKDIPEQISRMLHKDISDFFLFDGETLTRFEQRLRSADTSAALVRTSIEKVLGLPALQLLSRDIETLASETNKEVQRVAKKSAENEKVLKDIDATSTGILNKQNDLVELRRIGKQLEDEKLELEKQLAKIDSIKDAYHERKSIRDSKSDLQRDISEIRDQIKVRISESWWAPAMPMLKEKAAAIDSMLAGNNQLLSEINELQRKKLDLQVQISTKKCSSCQQVVNESQISNAQKEILEIEKKLESLPTPISNVDDIAFTKRQLNEFLEDGGVEERLRELDQDVLKRELRIDELSNKDRALTEVLSGNTLDIAALESQYQRANDFIRDSEREVEKKEFELTELKTQLRTLQNSLNRETTESSPVKQEAALLSSLEEVLKDSLEGFRKSMREKVGEEASDIFTKLTTEPDYNGLTITGKYYLEIVDSQKRIISRRSAGAEQIVAMSLIGALVRCAVRQGPVIMDTPFGRLDTGHRRRILEWAPTIGTQVMLFVQSGEFDRERDLKFLGNKVGREYRIQREASNRSSIVGANNG
ncbi:AAA family ATPase [Candidatus Planktophila dulcis]|uniref:AAA family ATPase n=1 Tax=Candidatus Planktophila dulcis TaxID=1884914 RepID=UPI003CEBEAA0